MIVLTWSSNKSLNLPLFVFTIKTLHGPIYNLCFRHTEYELVFHVNYSTSVLQKEVEGSSTLPVRQWSSSLCLKTSASLLIGKWKSGQAANSWGKLCVPLSPTVKTTELCNMTKAKEEPAKLECLSCNPKRLSASLLNIEMSTHFCTIW